MFSKVFTYNDLYFLPAGSYEIINGKKVDMTPAGFKQGKFELMIAKLLENNMKNKGYTAVGEVGILISREPFRFRTADVVYISKDTSPEEPEEILEVVPDLIVEILSKDDTLSEMNDKIRDYQSIGVKRIVFVDIFTELITVYQNGGKYADYYKFDEEFDLINGLKIKLKEFL